MAEGPLGRVVEFVTEHNVVVVLLMLVLTGGVAVGVTQLDLSGQAGDAENALGDTEVAQKEEYADEHYATNGSELPENFTFAIVYVQSNGSNVLSKDSLMATLQYQRQVLENDTVGNLSDQVPVVGVANVVARRAAGDPNASIEKQLFTLQGLSESQVDQIVRQTFTADSDALTLMPSTYEPGTANATSRRMVFRFRTGDADEETVSTATRAIYDSAQERENPEYFTMGEHAAADAQRVVSQNILELIVPAALLVILAVLAFAYRDLVDVIVGFTGVVLSVLWMFGILGWLGVSAGLTLVVGPVLVIGLSVDYGLHVFMRYREQREAGEDIRPPMRRSLSAVAVALGLVTVTTAVGFLANVTNLFPSIRSLAVGITLGVVSSFVIFVTLVPALKVTIDGLLERFGLDRRKAPLGKSGLLEPVLSTGVVLARRAAPVVIVIGLLAGAAGGAAWTELDRQSFQQQTEEVAEWKTELPEPFAWEVPEIRTHRLLVGSKFRTVQEEDRRDAGILIEGDVTDPATLERVDAGVAAAGDSDVVFQRGGNASVVSPRSVMAHAATHNETFAEVLADADTDGDGLPERNVTGVYDALYRTEPDEAARVIERTDDEYRSLRVVVSIRQNATFDAQATAMQNAAGVIEQESDLEATAIGDASVAEAEAIQTAQSILRTLLVALAAVFVMLMLVYRLVEGSASLGAITVVPIALVIALVIGGMYVFGVPLTLLTALLMSLVVGLGIDYNIHVSDRFAQELDAGRDPVPALREAVTGTGGALLGSTLTSVGAFSALLLHPHPQLQSFGTLVVLALALSFVVSVFVLPSMLLLWARRLGLTEESETSTAG